MLEYALEHHLTGERVTGERSPVHERVAVDLGHPVAGTVFGRGVRDGHIRQRQRSLQECERVQDPAGLIGHALLDQPRGQRHATPAASGDRHEVRSVAVTHGKMGGESVAHELIAGLVGGRRTGHTFKAEHVVVIDDFEPLVGNRGDDLQTGQVRQFAGDGNTRRAEHGHLHAISHLLEQPIAIGRLRTHAAVEPTHHARIAPTQRVVRQRPVHILVHGAIAQVLQRHGDIEVRVRIRHLVVLDFGGIKEHEHLARHRLDRTYAHLIERPIAHPRHNAFVRDAARGLTREFTIGRLDIVDGDCGQAVVVAHLAQPIQHVLRIFRLHIAIALRAHIPGLVQGFGRHADNIAAHPIQNLEAAVEQQLDTGKFRTNTLDQCHQRLLLLGRRRFVGGKQAVAVQRIQEQCAVALTPERADTLIDYVVAPLLLGQVGGLAVPALVARLECLARQALARTPVFGFAQAHIGECLGAVLLEFIELAFAHMLGLDHRPIELREHIDGHIVTVIDRHARLAVDIRMRTARHEHCHQGHQQGQNHGLPATSAIGADTRFI